MNIKSKVAESPIVLTVDEIEQAFLEAFPGHELHQEPVNFARAVERMVQAKLYPHHARRGNPGATLS
jgi:hypothetical protein